jgi:hypothetical protein
MSKNINKKVLNKCSLCAVKDNEITYLRKLIDNLLLRNGVAAVEKEVTADDVIEKELIPEGVERYGG